MDAKDKIYINERAEYLISEAISCLKRVSDSDCTEEVYEDVQCALEELLTVKCESKLQQRVPDGWKMVPSEMNSNIQSALFAWIKENTWFHPKAIYQTILDAAPQPPEAGQWISVDERVPDVLKVRVKLSDGSEVNCWAQSDGDFYWKGGGYEAFIRGYRVTHWMPAPQEQREGK